MVSFLLQRILVIWYQMMLLGSTVLVVSYGIYLVGKLCRDFIRMRQTKRLLTAVWEERETEIIHLVNKLHAHNLIFAQGENLLYYAIKAHRKKAVTSLLLAHVPIEYEINHRFRVSVLSMAIVEKEPLEYIELLVNAGANLRYRDGYDKTPLEYARETQRSEIIYLLEQKKTSTELVNRNHSRVEQTDHRDDHEL